MKKTIPNEPLIIDGKGIVITGKFAKIAQLRDEHYVPVEDPELFLGKLKEARVKADIVTFVQEIHDKVPRYKFTQEWESLAVLPMTTYEKWFNHQINFKPRNKIKKALKNGVETRKLEFDDELVRGIMGVYNETPIRQGKRNLHYGKDFETVKREHGTFLERSEFIGAFYQNEMIGFAKVTHSKNYSILMNIVAMISKRDRAPANALLAKTIELCTKRNIPYLNYGIWGRRGLSDFKVANGFERFDLPRYFVPLTAKGRWVMTLNLHRKLKDYLPERSIILAAELRGKWNEFRYRGRIPKAGSPVSAAAR